MSEKIYVWLLRFYPSHFREAHGEEALQLFRDRSREEAGFFPRLRLWLDLLTDLAVSLSRMRRHAGFSLALGGAPSFHGRRIAASWSAALRKCTVSDCRLGIFGGTASDSNDPLRTH
jgi:hypothetical protein